jgi:hypothetical protein
MLAFAWTPRPSKGWRVQSRISHKIILSAA